jgi:hypothetical protein
VASKMWTGVRLSLHLLFDFLKTCPEGTTGLSVGF